MTTPEDLRFGNISSNEQGADWTEECKDLLEMQQYADCTGFCLVVRLMAESLTDLYQLPRTEKTPHSRPSNLDMLTLRETVK